jgi:hypothetical protein
MAECEDKTRLIAEYQEATAKFFSAVTELKDRLGKSSKDEYQRLQRRSEDGRVTSEQARLVLEQHIASHGC